MFIRFRSRQKKLKHHKEPRTILYADLVETYRNPEDRKVKHRYLTYLGSIDSDRVDLLGHRAVFWETADRNIEKINLNPQVWEPLQAKLAQKIPRPTPEEWEAATQQ